MRRPSVLIARAGGQSPLPCEPASPAGSEPARKSGLPDDALYSRGREAGQGEGGWAPPLSTGWAYLVVCTGSGLSNRPSVLPLPIPKTMNVATKKSATIPTPTR
jgi:hypothetical protein